MLKSELIEKLSEQFTDISVQNVNEYTSLLVDAMINAISHGKRIEIRGFGSFALTFHEPRNAHNPKTGQRIMTKGKYRPHFKPGKELRARVNHSGDK